MKARFLFIALLLCSTFVAKGQLRINLIPENREVCPTRGGNPLPHEYTATPAAGCNFIRWEATQQHPVLSLPYLAVTGNALGHTQDIFWNTPVATFNSQTQTWSLPRGRITITNQCNTEQRVTADVTLLSVRGLAFPRVRFGETPNIIQLQNGHTHRVPYNSTAPIRVAVERIRYPNSERWVTGYQWSIPSGWRARHRNYDDTIFREPDASSEHFIWVYPDACSGGQIKVRPLDIFCGNQYIEELKGAWITINVERTSPTISIGAYPTVVPFGQETPVTFTANVPPIYGVQQFEWTVSGDFTEAETEIFTTTTNTFQRAHRGFSSGTVSVRAIYCGNRSVARSVSVNYDPNTLPRISAPPNNAVCPGTTATFYVQNLPDGLDVNWIVNLPLSKESVQGDLITIRHDVAPLPPIPRVVYRLKAEIKSGNQVIHTLYRDLTIGRPTMESLIIPSSVTTGGIHFFTANHNSPPNAPTWQVSPNFGVVMVPWANNRLEIGFSVAGWYTVTATVSNACGTATESRMVNVTGFTPPVSWCIMCPAPHIPPCRFCPGIVPPSLHGIELPVLLGIASPNPVDNILTIDLTQATTNAFENQTTSEIIFNVRLLNAQGMIVRQQRTQAATIQFDVSNLPEGTYYLQIEHGGEIEKHQIIVQRN